ncbi:MAG: hypothetical protein JNJ98_18315, partial [Gemmatimonadetes bacterium]|nr:hypothetical protein [Gemmatimonadota bacterium]
MTDRRNFLTRFSAAVGAFGAAMAATPDAAGAQEPRRWQGERHPQDEWLDALPGKHRFFFDSSTAT